MTQPDSSNQQPSSTVRLKVKLAESVKDAMANPSLSKPLSEVEGNRIQPAVASDRNLRSLIDLAGNVASERECSTFDSASTQNGFFDRELASPKDRDLIRLFFYDQDGRRLPMSVSLEVYDSLQNITLTPESRDAVADAETIVNQVFESMAVKREKSKDASQTRNLSRALDNFLSQDQLLLKIGSGLPETLRQILGKHPFEVKQESPAVEKPAVEDTTTVRAKQRLAEQMKTLFRDRPII